MLPWLKLLGRLRGQDRGCAGARRGAVRSAAPVAGSPREAERFISVSQAYTRAPSSTRCLSRRRFGCQRGRCGLRCSGGSGCR